MNKGIENINEANQETIENKEELRNVEIKEENEPEITDEETKKNIYGLISSIFDDDNNKSKIIKRLRPYFSMKVVPQRNIDKVYSAVEKIDPKKIDVVEEFEYEEEKYDSKNIFETKSKSLGLSNNDLDLSVNIFGHKQSFNYSGSEDKKDNNMNSNTKIHCIHSIVISLFRIVIDYKDIKLAKQVDEDLKEVENSKATEKKILLEKFVEKFGLFIPLELIVGGRINISFEANNEEEKKLYHNNLHKGIKANLGGKISFISGRGKLDYSKTNTDSNFSQFLDKIENASIKMIGGDYLCKDDLKKWIKSFNINNLQVIEYKTLIPIYCFIPNLEKKLKICLKEYEEIVLQEIFNLLESKYINEEKNVISGTSINSNSWGVGIIKDNYESFQIYKKKIVKKLNIDKFTLKRETISVEDIICGDIPEENIICGWTISTNANSKTNEIICTWSRRKELGILGSRYYRFKVDATGEKGINDSNAEIEWILEIYYINIDYLVQSNRRSSTPNENNNYIMDNYNNMQFYQNNIPNQYNQNKSCNLKTSISKKNIKNY